jgi:hypothetical protein
MIVGARSLERSKLHKPTIAPEVPRKNKRMLHRLLGLLIFFGFFCFVIWMWCKIGYKVSSKGWTDFSRVFGVKELPSKQSYWWRSGSFGWQGSYSRILNVVLLPEGIGLSVSIIFRFAHPPLLVPWSHVVSVEETGLLFFKRLCITLSGANKTFKFYLPMRAQKEILKYNISIK